MICYLAVNQSWKGKTSLSFVSYRNSLENVESKSTGGKIHCENTLWKTFSTRNGNEVKIRPNRKISKKSRRGSASDVFSFRDLLCNICFIRSLSNQIHVHIIVWYECTNLIPCDCAHAWAGCCLVAVDGSWKWLLCMHWRLLLDYMQRNCYILICKGHVLTD